MQLAGLGQPDFGTAVAGLLMQVSTPDERFGVLPPHERIVRIEAGGGEPEPAGDFAVEAHPVTSVVCAGDGAHWRAGAPG